MVPTLQVHRSHTEKQGAALNVVFVNLWAERGYGSHLSFKCGQWEHPLQGSMHEWSALLHVCAVMWSGQLIPVWPELFQ